MMRQHRCLCCTLTCQPMWDPHNVVRQDVRTRFLGALQSPIRRHGRHTTRRLRRGRQRGRTRQRRPLTGTAAMTSTRSLRMGMTYPPVLPLIGQLAQHPDKDMHEMAL